MNTPQPFGPAGCTLSPGVVKCEGRTSRAILVVSPCAIYIGLTHPAPAHLVSGTLYLLISLLLKCWLLIIYIYLNTYTYLLLFKNQSFFCVRLKCLYPTFSVL